MTALKVTISCFALAVCLGGCQSSTSESSASQSDASVSDASQAATSQQGVSQQATSQNTQLQSLMEVETLIWDDLMPAGEDDVLTQLYTEFYENQAEQFKEQMSLSQAAQANDNLMSLIGEGDAADTMEQIGTYNVVADLNGANIRMPGYVVPLDFNASSEYSEFLLVPYFGACLHTPPPPPNQIVYIKSSPATKIDDIYEPVWVEGIMRTGEFGSELGNSAYELTLAKLEPYEY